MSWIGAMLEESKATVSAECLGSGIDTLTVKIAMLKIFGYLWTFGWISYSMRYAASYQFETGPLNHHEPLKFSPIDFIVSKLAM